MGKNKALFKKPPVNEAVFEIKFPAEPAIECNRDRIYKKIRNEYPKVFVPIPSQGKPLSFEPYRYEKDDGSNGIMLTINSLAYYSKKYPGYATYKSETLKLLKLVVGMFNITKLTRTGLRYLNIIPFSRRNNIIPLSDYLNIGISLPKGIPCEFSNVEMSFVTPKKDGNITTKVKQLISQDKAKEAILLDFDYWKEGNLLFTSVEQYINESHSTIREMFDKLITESYYKVLRGDVIK